MLKNWIFLSLVTAFSVSFVDVIRKKVVHNTDPLVVALGTNLFQFIFLLPLVATGKFTISGTEFFYILGASCLLLWIVSLLYANALKWGELSSAVPMLCFSPVFLLLTSTLMLGEFPSTIGLIGILLIVAGGYIINKKNSKSDLANDPQQTKNFNFGKLLMLGVAVIWSITANLDKIGVGKSSPELWSVSIFGTLSLLCSFSCIAAIGFKETYFGIKRNLGRFSLIGFIGAAGIFTQLLAINLTIVPYVISIKRISTGLCVIWGALFFKEKSIKEKLLGVFLMLIGVFLIVVLK